MEILERKLHSEKTWTGFLYSLSGITLPFLISLIGIFIIQKYEHIISFIDDGQILLFSAGLATGAFYLFRDEENQKALKKSVFKFDRLLSHLSIFFIIISSVIYAILYSIEISHKNIDVNINLWFVRIASILLFILSSYTSYRSIYIDFLKIYPNIDVKSKSNEEVENILEGLGND
ncbi:MAG: hypothetical protein IPH62_18260 [Ignavibacteriae bacterium]|nr:hypothetical protein [Ignavibacteriota bacterium]